MGTVVKLDFTAVMTLAGGLKDVLPIDILPQPDREDLARQMRVRRFKADEVIYHRGDDSGGHANVVFEGLVKVMLLNEDGHEAMVGLHGRGEFFGEIALFTDAPRDATVIAVLPTTLLQLTRDSSWRVLDRNPKARDWMFAHLSGTIQKLEDKYESIVFLDVPGRLAKYLLELDHDGGKRPITQDDIAAAIGSTRVTVNKLLADLERRQVVQVERRRIAITDRTALEQEIRR